MRERRKEGNGFKRIHNQMGEARPLNLLNIAAWLISTCLHPRPFFCLSLGNHVLTPCVLAPCAKTNTRNQQTSNGRKRCKEHMKEDKADKHDRHGKQRNKKGSKQARRQTSKKANKRWCPRVWIKCPYLHCVEVWTTH